MSKVTTQSGNFGTTFVLPLPWLWYQILKNKLAVAALHFTAGFHKMEKLTNGRKCDQSRDDDRESCQLTAERRLKFSVFQKYVCLYAFSQGGIIFLPGFFRFDSTVSGGVGSRECGKLKPRNSKKHELLGAKQTWKHNVWVWSLNILNFISSISYFKSLWLIVAQWSQYTSIALSWVSWWQLALIASGSSLNRPIAS